MTDERLADLLWAIQLPINSHRQQEWLEEIATHIDALTAENERLTAEVTRLREELDDIDARILPR